MTSLAVAERSTGYVVGGIFGRQTATAVSSVVQPLFGVRTSVLVASSVGGAQQPLLVNLRGPDVTELQRISDAIALEMAEIPGVVDINTSLGQPKPEYRIGVNRDLANELALDIGEAHVHDTSSFVGSAAPERATALGSPPR